MKTFINFIKEAKWKIGDRIIPNPRYNKNDKWAKKHGVVTKILSGGKIEIKLDGEVLPTVLKSNEIIKEYRQDQISSSYSKNREYIKKVGIKKITNSITKLLMKNNYVPSVKKGDSYYIDVFSPWKMGFKISDKYNNKELFNSREVEFVASIRISDHISPSGGGYNQETGYGHGNPDIFVDPQNGIDIKKVINQVNKISKENDIIPFTEAYKAYSKDSSCHQYSQQEINDLEKFADRLLKKWDIDIEFTKHFRDRMGDGRNHPCIKVGEMQDLFKKIEKRQGDKIKDYGKGQVVIIDMQKDLNLPVVINIKKNGEFEVIAKTVMRKKDYMTRNKRLKY